MSRTTFSTTGEPIKLETGPMEWSEMETLSAFVLWRVESHMNKWTFLHGGYLQRNGIVEFSTNTDKDWLNEWATKLTDY